MAQQGYAYTFQGLLRITRMVHRLEEAPLDSTCDCFTCRRHGRAYVHHLMRGKHALGSRLLSIHNLRHYQALMARMREAILAGRFAALVVEMRALWE
jgi:queuine tRNA-ribosyltransferase